MWPGQQPPGGEQNPQAQNNPYQQPGYQQPGYQQPNPYQQPGYQQQPNPYTQPQWGAPSPAGAPTPPPGTGGGGGGTDRTKLVAIVAASAVVVAAGVTGFLVLGGGDDEKTDAGKGSPSPTTSVSAPASDSSGTDDNPRGNETEKPTVAGWKVVVNPKWGLAYDVPADWEVQSPGLSQGFEWEDKTKSDGYDRILQGGTAELKSKWCSTDSDKDGKTEDTALAVVGSKGADGAKTTDEIAINTPAWWVFGGYTEPDKKSLTFDKKATAFTTASGIKGSYAWARSTNTPQKGKCDSDGKAITFGFKNSTGDFVSVNLYGAKGVKDELPNATIMQILSTVRLHGTPTHG
ncbi:MULTISPECIES: hypothetical protein [unclassified Streptomyces]|uniref:hypothetical protein n=1 Tax=unclassified Streptomyces TaxID=2593676 RepID=UPI0029B6FD63|nr:hypothetical protein [Streptomyces sp. FL07-04A]MDX3579777.1 hypothetical protein [Streptomyces sp. FL07-04A]